jgi:spore maturation protein CgeB
MPLFLCPEKGGSMNSIKKKSISTLIEGLSKYEDSKDAVKNSDFTDLKTFIKDYLNTSEPKQRKKLAEEFRKRHIELHQFLKDNAELIAAETEITKIMNAAEAGEQVETDNSRITNLLEMIGESANDL